MYFTLTGTDARFTPKTIYSHGEVKQRETRNDMVMVNHLYLSVPRASYLGLHTFIRIPRNKARDGNEFFYFTIVFRNDSLVTLHTQYQSHLGGISGVIRIVKAFVHQNKVKASRSVNHASFVLNGGSFRRYLECLGVWL